MRIIFVRHGEPCYEKDNLTNTGEKQAQLLIDRLRNEGIEEIWSSPLGRAKITAEYTAESLHMPVKILDFMRELSWGSIDGNPIFADGHPWDIADDMAKNGINLCSTDWAENEYFKNNIVVDSVKKVEAGIDNWLSGYGYNRNGFYYAHETADKDHRTIALFSHGGSSCAAMGHILNLPFPYMCAMLHIEFTGITILRMDKSKGPGTLPILELANDAKHIY